MEAVINGSGTALLAIDEIGAVMLANTPARHLLGVGEADIGRPFQDLPISYRPIELRGPIDEAFRQRHRVRLEDQEYRLSQNQVLRLSVDIRPLQRPDGSVHAVLLAFHDQTRLFTLQRDLEAAHQSLETSIEELQSANEELETANEELQSSNEELETTNEELQSINEELETLNEEARSSYEEMGSGNEELRIQAEQASNYRLYLESVLRAMNGGLIVMDEKRRILSWNRWSENAWGLRAEDVLGTNFDTLDIGLPVQAMRDVLGSVQYGDEDQAETVVEGLDRRGRRIVCRVRISGLLDDNGGSQGLVLVFRDVNDERVREEYARHLGEVISSERNEIYLVDRSSLRFVMTNEGGQRRLGFALDHLSRIALPDVIEDMGVAQVHAALAPLLTGSTRQVAFECRLRTAEGQTFRGTVQVQAFADGSQPMLILSVRDADDSAAAGETGG